jgi:hypothetical protein
VKRYKFQALVTLDPLEDGAPATMPPGQMRRMVVQGQHHATGGSRFFSALVTKNSTDPAWSDGHMVVTIVLVGDEPREYFEAGDGFGLWLGSDLGHGVVTRRLFV